MRAPRGPIRFGCFAAALCGFAGCDPRETAPPVPALELLGVVSDDMILAGAHDVELQGDIAYVAGKWGGLAVVNVADPSKPALLGSIVDAEAIEDAETVLPMGDIVLLGARDLLAIDVSDPRNPRIAARVSDRPRIDRINGMTRHGRHVFAAGKSGWITVFDVSEPANPRYLDAFDTRAGGQPQTHDIASWGDKLVAVSAHRGADHQLRVYEPFGPDGELLPAARWGVGPGVGGAASASDMGGANRVAVRGDFAFVGAFASDRLVVVDLKAARQTANIPVCDIDATGLEVAGDVVFVSGGECVEAIDVSRPDDPVSIAQLRKGELFPTRKARFGEEWRYDNGHDLAYRDGLLYVTAQIDNRLGVVRVNDPGILALALR